MNPETSVSYHSCTIERGKVPETESNRLILIIVVHNKWREAISDREIHHRQGAGFFFFQLLCLARSPPLIIPGTEFGKLRRRRNV